MNTQKYIAYIACSLFAMIAGTTTSCISDDEEEITSECYISSFSVGDITTTLHTTTADGIDSTYQRTIDGKSVKFNIDQVNGRIYSVDSLPIWVDLTRVVPSISCSAQLYARIDSTYYPISGSGDSLNLSTPLDLLVVATDGVSTKHYTAVIYHAAINADSLLWTQMVNSNLLIADNRRMLVYKEQIAAFGTYNGSTCVSTSTDGETWSSPQPLSAPSASIDTQSVVTFNGKLYALDTDGHIQTTDNLTNWQTATAQTVSKLLAADAYYLYAYDGTSIIATPDLSQWHTAGNRNINMLPQSDLVALTYPAHTNPNLMVSLLLGNTPNAKNAAVWYKIAAPDASNQQWDYISVTAENPYPLPSLSPFTAFHFDDALYAMCGTYKQFYRSNDNGITWHEVTQYQFPPHDLQPAIPVNTLTWGNYIWMAQTGLDGKVYIWKGKLNR